MRNCYGFILCCRSKAKIPICRNLLLIACCLLPTCIYSQTWNKVGTGVYGETQALGIYKNELYFGGAYSKSPPITIAKWDGSVWTPLDNTSASVYCFLEYNNELYVGGNFGSVDGVNAARIAKWNGTNWIALTITGSINYIKNLAAFNGEVYAAGDFSSIGGVTTRGIAKWNGTSWSAVSGGLSGGFPTSRGFALVNLNNDLYVGGSFAMAGNVSANYVASWNGTAWDSLGSGTNSNVNAMVVDTINNFLYMAGIFDYIGGKHAFGVAKWDGFQLDSAGSPFGPGKTCLEMYHGQLYAGSYGGGYSSSADTVLIRWDGRQWHNVIGPNDYIEALKVYKDELYVGGAFTQIGNDTTIKYIARYSAPWDSSSCKFLQPVIESMHSLTAPSGVTNTFYYTDSVAVQFYNNIASASSWQWDFADGKNGSGKTPVHYYKTAGTYTVSVIVNYPFGPKGPCIDTTYKTITVTNNTGIKELVNNLKFKVYPNPAKAEININVEGGENKEYIARIYNSAGAKITEQKFSKQIKISTAGFSKGVYQVQVCYLSQTSPLPPSKGDSSPTGEGNVCHTEKVVVQ